MVLINEVIWLLNVISRKAYVRYSKILLLASEYAYDLLIAKGMLRCGHSNKYIKPECVCSFHNVYEATLYHAYSSCPEGTESDMVTQLKCKISMI